MVVKEAETMKRRMIFGVIAANAADIEQREILSGAIRTAQSLNIDIAVISNIYNPIDTADVLKAENNIYDLISSDELDGIILISEAILNPDVQELIISRLAKKSVPTIVVGTVLKGFTMPSFHYVNTSDENDIEDITDHLIDVHGFTDIHILTGHENLEVSHKRINGYRTSLEKHGIAYDDSKVFFGDYWMNSGHAQAKRYISGELTYPQALICCNDYMAYGLLDEFMEQDIDITEKMSVVGYEYVRERRNHTPLLTTYQRNRSALGEDAVQLLARKISTGRYKSVKPPKGRIICGDTCPCGAKNPDIKREIKDVQVKATYDFLNLFSQLEHRLTECRNIDEFVARCWDFQFMIRGVDKLYMCLYENWYDDAENSENMISYNLLYHEEPLIFRKNDFSCLFREEAAPYYFCPLFFAERELGFVVLRFKKPDTFDHIFRNWLKSISNGLEFLHMKNDIQYLMQCQDLSEQRDTMIDMLSEKGIKKAYKTADRSNMYLVGLRICLFGERPYGADPSEKIFAVLDAAEAVKQFCGNNNICGRINDDTFVCLVSSTAEAELLTEQLSATLYRHTAYVKEYGIDSFVCAAVKCSDMKYAQVSEKCNLGMNERLKQLSQRRTDPHFKKLNRLRTHYYTRPEDTFDSDKLYEMFGGSAGYLRTIFRNCYGFTLHEDCIKARIAFVRYHLTMTTLTIGDIAERCGYTDGKYLMRQFQQATGCTASQYREVIG